MIYRKGIRNKTITAQDGFEFDSKLNAFVEKLEQKRIEYEVKLDPVAGFLAFVTYKVEKQIPENKRDEHELAGDRFKCGSCPMLSKTTDGRFKNLRCTYNGRLCHIEDTPCCNAFYEWMESGKWPEYKEEETEKLW